MKLTKQDLANLIDDNGIGYILTQVEPSQAEDFNIREALYFAQYWFKKLREALPKPEPVYRSTK